VAAGGREEKEREGEREAPADESPFFGWTIFLDSTSCNS